MEQSVNWKDIQYLKRNCLELEVDTLCDLSHFGFFNT